MNAGNWRAFRAIFWKEWREHAKWALLAFVSVCIALCYFVTVRLGILDYRPKSFTDFWSGVEMIYYVAPRLIAIMLGMLQVLPELRRDRWAFLLHLPCSRGVLFAGKAAAGIALLFTATAAPLLAAALWARQPGHLAAPFDWGVTWTAATQILASIPLYFASLLTALRPNRWYGGRMLPIIMGLLTGFLLVSVDGLSHSYVLCGICLLSIVTALAAWGGVVHREEARLQHWAARASGSVVMYVGVLLVCVIPYLIVQSAWDGQISAQRTYTEYGLAYDGQIVREQYNSRRYVRVTAAEAGAKRTRYTWSDVAHSSYPIVSPWLEEASELSGAPHSGVVLAANAVSEQYGMVHWYYLREHRNFAGYSARTKQMIGVMGPRGFTPGAAANNDNVFSEDLSQVDQQKVSDFGWGAGWKGAPVSYVFGSQVYAIHWNALKVAPLFSGGNERIVSVNEVKRISGYWDTSYLISTTAHFALISSHGQTLFVTPREYSLPDYDTVRLNVTEDHKYLFWYVPGAHGLINGKTIQVTEISPTGEVLKRVALPPISPGEQARYEDSRFAGIVVPPFVAIVGAVGEYVLVLRQNPSALGFWSDIQYHRVAWTSFIWISFVAGLCAGVLTWLVTRRCGLAWRDCLGWALSFVLIGLPGLFTLLAMRPWPARVVCSACGKRRIVTHTQCEHCGAAFPEAKRDGTEIFESPTLILHTEAA
ncbi:MAG: hypothetical protein ABIY70_04565 [Capsulimonas sp.]|uniref:hypothetical protein n=1 Tax=Capsulimonas sp. TaxID=2494211 RepID=UPI003263BBC6